MKTDTFQKIAEHDHTGSGKGTQIGTAAIVADAVTGAKIRLDNDEYLRGRNFADSDNLSIVKVNASDLMEFGLTANNFNIKNNTFITGRNQANSDNIDIIKVDGGDKLEVGTDVSKLNLVNDLYLQARNQANSGYINIAKVDTSDNVLIEAHTISQQSSVTLADNQPTTSAGVITLGSNEAAKIHYRIVRNTDVQSGTLEIEQSGDLLFDEYIGDDTGVTFSLNSGALEYATTSTGNTAAFTYVIIKK